MVNSKTSIVDMFLLLIFLSFLPHKTILASTPDEIIQADIEAISELRTHNNKSEIENMASNLELKWRNHDPNQYAQKMINLCTMLYLNDIGKNAEMHKEYAEKAVDHLGEAISGISVYDEISLLLYASKSADALTSISKRDTWPEDREAIAIPYFHALERFLKTIDPNWDINQSANPPELPIDESSGFRYTSEMNIKEPNLLNDYRGRLIEKNKAAIKYSEQFNLRKCKQNRLPEIHDYFVLLYSCPNNDSIQFDLEAFKTDLKNSVADEEIRSQIEDIVVKPKEQLYTLREEESKIILKDITEQLSIMSEWQDIIEMPEDEQMCLRIQNALASARNLWEECQGLVSSKKVHLSSFSKTPQYSSSLKPEGEKIGYNLIFKSAGLELQQCVKYVYEDEAGRNIIRDKSCDLIFYPYGPDIKFYRRGISKEQIHFYPGNKIKMYVLQIEEGKWYSISWDHVGRIVKEYTYTR